MIPTPLSFRKGQNWANSKKISVAMGWSRRRAQTEHACMCAQLCSTLRDPMDCSPPGSSVHGILLAKILQWVAIFFPRRSSQPGDRIHVSCIAAAKSRQSCLTLCDPMDCSLPGSSVHGSFQARVLEWVASAFSENSHLEQLKIAVTFIYSVIIHNYSSLLG